MVIQCRVTLCAAVAFLLLCLPASTGYASSWGPREDVGVAAVDTRTGKVLWEAWRLDEVPADASKEEKTAVEYLLAEDRDSKKPLPRVTLLPDFPVKDLDIKNPWLDGIVTHVTASEGKTLIYYRHGMGIIALDRGTKKEAWRLETTRYPYNSVVLEVRENQALIQIGSDIPTTIHLSLVGDQFRRLPRLEPRTLKQRAAAAVLLHHYGEGYHRPEVQKLVEQLRAEKNDPIAAKAATAIEKLLANWPKKRDSQRYSQRLLEGCIAALLRAEEGNPHREFPWPEAHRVLVWCLLQELIYGSPRDGYSRQGFNYAYEPWGEVPVSLADATKAKLASHCRKVVGEGPDAEKPFAASVLVSTAIGWSKLTDVERKKLFLSSEPSAWRWAALALSKNGRRKELMEWVRERPASDHLDVIWLIKRDKPKGWPEEELKFWLACARHDAGGVAYVLRTFGEPAPKEFREPILAYLESELAKPTVKDTGTQPAYSLMAALTLLEAWENLDDTTLLLDYLKHPASSTGIRPDGEHRTEIRTYGVRAHVRGLLAKRRVEPSPGVVYEEVVGPAKE